MLNDGTETKRVLKRLALRYLPEDIVNRPKLGFGPPDPCWSHTRLLDLADDLLGSGSRLSSYLDGKRLQWHLARQREPRLFNLYQIWELLVLELWLRNASRSVLASAA